MEIGLTVHTNLQVDAIKEYLRHVEKMAVDHLWVGEIIPKNSAFVRIATILEIIKGNKQVWSGVTSPFYYDVHTLIAIINTFVRLYPEKFGLGLGIGNLKFIKNKDVITKPFTAFKDKIFQLKQEWQELQNSQKFLKFPPLAIGGIGNKMCAFAGMHSDIFLLNSTSLYDVIRTYGILERIRRKEKKDCKLFSYAMLQIQEKEDLDPLLWNIVKDIVVSLPIDILKSHKYSAKMIARVKSLSNKWDKTAPKGELRSIVHDFALIGTEEEIVLKLQKLKEKSENHELDGIVLSLFNFDNNWTTLNAIINQIKK